ncbi:SNF1-interacting protein [Umbelopsis nana]
MGLHPSKEAPNGFDNGSLLPTGIYAASIQDYDYPTVRQLILQRRLAPFYQGRQDTDVAGQSDSVPENLSMPTPSAQHNNASITPNTKAISPRNILPTVSKYRPHRKPSLPQTIVNYENAVECPICFLNIVDTNRNERVVTVDLIRPYHTRTLPPRHHRHSISGSANGSTRRIIVRPSHAGISSNRLSPAARDYHEYLTAVRQLDMDLEELMVGVVADVCTADLKTDSLMKSL